MSLHYFTVKYRTLSLGLNELSPEVLLPFIPETVLLDNAIVEFLA